MQNKQLTVIESITHASLGFLIGLLVVAFLAEFGYIIGMNITIDWKTNIQISLTITGINMIKAYYLRRYFTKLRG